MKHYPSGRRAGRLRWGILALVFGVLAWPGFYCKSSTPEPREGEAWRNVYDTTVKYVGMETCRSCHGDVHDTYRHTGMGLSFDHATLAKTSARFSDHTVVYDADLDFYYKPYWDSDSLYIMEYRLEGTDTVHKLVQKVDYIIGSGQHTNSHLFEEGGYFYQAPITYYTQKGRWDLAPGFEEGMNTRFSRIIELECMSCHNGFPDFDEGSLNRFVSVKEGIDCERCHGPGEIHVRERLAGTPVDTSLGPDYSIVNPRRLSVDLQNSLCQRCHLQGIAVLREGKTFFDFRPGMALSEVMQVFMPQYEGAEDKMIMASHVERLQMSPCFVQSRSMSCITCHNPHVSVKLTAAETFNAACQNCHSGSGSGSWGECTESPARRKAAGDHCYSCHMPQNGSIDIPHVAVTDHYIRRRPFDDSSQSRISAFLGLRSINPGPVDPLLQARAYMEFFERYNARDFALLDSAAAYLLPQAELDKERNQSKNLIRLAFLREQYAQVLDYAGALSPREGKDAWTAYRIGESYYLLEDYSRALDWYRQAITLLPRALDFQSKFGSCLMALGEWEAATRVFEQILEEQPRYPIAHANLGFLFLRRGDFKQALAQLERAHQLDPDHEQTLINLAVCHYRMDQPSRSRVFLQRLLKKNPGHEQARAMLADLHS